MIKYFIHNGVAVGVMGLAILLFGVLALFSVPIQLTPDVTTPTITVETRYPGATPDDIEQDILIEQEEYLKNIPGLEKMTSTASLGQGSIELEFAVGSDMNEKMVRVNNALSQVPSYPENVDEPSLSTDSASDQPVAWFSVRVLPERRGETDILDYFDYLDDTIKPRLERIPGVSDVQGVYGGSDRQLMVFLDPVKLAERGISISQVRNAIRDNNRDLSGGDLNEGKRRYNVRTEGRIQSPADMETRIITLEEDGTPIRLRDVGYARMGLAEARSLIRHNTEPAFAFGVKHQSGTNLLVVMEEVKKVVADLNANDLKDRGLYITQVTDDTEYIEESVAMVQMNLLIGGLLAFLSLTVFLRNIRSTIVLGISIPLSITGALFLMYISGRSINVISLAGLAFSIGAVLDSSIVVLENIFRHRTLGEDSFTAAFKGTKEVWTAIFTSMTTNLVVFIPIITLEDEAGQLFRDIAIAITYANIMAFLVSVLIIPALAARLLRKHGTEPKHGLVGLAQNLFGLLPLAMMLYRAIGAALNFILRSVILRILMASGIIAMAVALIVVFFPQTEYLPDGNQNSIFGLLIPPQGYNLEEMSQVGTKLESELMPYVNASVEDYETGRIDGPPMRDFFFVAFGTQMFTFTRAKDASMASDVPGLLVRYFSQIPGMIPISMQRSIFSQGIGGARNIELDITGLDYGQVTFITLQAFLKVQQALEGAQARPEPGMEIGQPQLTIKPDWLRASELGFTAQEIGYGAWVLGDGAYVDDYYQDGKKIDIYMYSTSGAFDTLANFDTMRISNARGTTIPLSEVAQVDFTFVPEQIRRVDSQRAVTLSVTPPKDISLEQTLEIIETDVIGALKNEGMLPEGYQIEIAGSSDKLSSIINTLRGDVLLAGALVYLTMVLIFKHWGHPVTIMMAIPIGLTGGVIGLKLLNAYLHVLTGGTVIQSMDVLTMLGFIILLGSVVNNPILIVEQSLNFMREGGHGSSREAIVEATLSRIRPMLMTTVTTVFGLMPLVLVPGAGTEIYRGLGAVMFGGLLVGTVVTLLFIPCVMSLLVDFGEKFMAAEHAFEEKVLHISHEEVEKPSDEDDRPRP